MILYDKNSVFLGMSNQELYFLGYEDMEEFRNYCNDIADLFINRPGYIFKFQNFSWIEYALHSGTPNKKVIVKTKHGKEIETSLTINEIFLSKELSDSSKLYCVELSTVISKQISSIPTMDNGLFQANTQEVTSFTPPAEPSVTEYTPNLISDFKDDADYTPSFEHEEIKSNTIDFTEEETTTVVFEESSFTPEEPSSIFKESFSPSSDFKLKFDHDILEPALTADEDIFKPEPTIVEEDIFEPAPTIAEESLDTTAQVGPVDYSSIDEITIDDLTFDLPQENYIEDNNEDLQNDPNLFVETPKLKKKEEAHKEEPFDFCLIAEELGLDISLIAQIVSEYADEIDLKMPRIADYIENNNFDLAQSEIEKLKSVALNLTITSLFYQFEHLEKSLQYDTKQELKHSLDILNKEIAIFKTNLQ